MNTRFLKLIGPALALPLALAFPALSQASFMDCVGDGYDISGYVDPSSDCAILEPLDGHENDSEALVNAEEFFTFDDWLLDGKYDSENNIFVDNSVLFTFTGDGQLGTFTYVGGGFDHDDIMFIFKDGGSTNLVGYLIDMTALLADPYNGTGTYRSPFVIPPFSFTGDPPRDISHISVYYREGGDITLIPEPALLILFGTGLLAMGWTIRRRNRAERLDG